MIENVITVDDITNVNINSLGKKYPFLTALYVSDNGRRDWHVRRDYCFIDNNWFSLGRNMLNMHPSEIKKWVKILYEEMKSKNETSIVWGGDVHGIYSSNELKKSEANYDIGKANCFIFSEIPYEQPNKVKELKGHNTHKKSPRKSCNKFVCPEKMF